MRKLSDADAGNLYAMKVLKKATLKGIRLQSQFAAYFIVLYLNYGLLRNPFATLSFVFVMLKE